MNLQSSTESVDGTTPSPIVGAESTPAGVVPLSKVGVWDWTRCIIAYLRGETGILLATVAAITILVLLLISYALDWSRLLTWEGMGTVSGILAVAVGLIIFLSETKENAAARLPKRLSVYFLDPNEHTTRLVCQGAHLFGEGDIRAWGQQIGLQICDHKDVRHLEFTPFADLRRLGVVKYDGVLVTHYQAVFRLRILPDVIRAELQKKEQETGVKMAKVLRKAGDPYGGVVIALENAADYRPAP